MTLTYDLYWSFRSPYSYLVTLRLIALERDFDVAARVRPVYPIAVRQPDFFTSNDPLWLSYFLRDIGRSAAFVATNQSAQRDGGHYGVPLMVFEGEPFFGQDRFDQLQWRMEQHGLTRR